MIEESTKLSFVWKSEKKIKPLTRLTKKKERRLKIRRKEEILQWLSQK